MRKAESRMLGTRWGRPAGVGEPGAGRVGSSLSFSLEEDWRDVVEPDAGTPGNPAEELGLGAATQPEPLQVPEQVGPAHGAGASGRGGRSALGDPMGTWVVTTQGVDVLAESGGGRE